MMQATSPPFLIAFFTEDLRFEHDKKWAAN